MECARSDFLSVVSVAVIAVAVVRWLKELLELMPGEISDDTVLDISAKDALLRERHGILVGVDSPAQHPAEEERTVGLACDVLVQVVLEELFLPRCCLLIHILCLF